MHGGLFFIDFAAKVTSNLKIQIFWCPANRLIHVIGLNMVLMNGLLGNEYCQLNKKKPICT